MNKSVVALALALNADLVSRGVPTNTPFFTIDTIYGFFVAGSALICSDLIILCCSAI